jgi:hypothetical protein
MPHGQRETVACLSTLKGPTSLGQVVSVVAGDQPEDELVAFWAPLLMQADASAFDLRAS